MTPRSPEPPPVPLTEEQREFIRDLIRTVPPGDLPKLAMIVQAYETWQSWGLLGRTIIWAVITGAALIVAVSTIISAKWPGN